jgi:IS5 family transposase
MSEQRTLQPTSEQIARAAYLMWEQEGRPHGRDMAHWLKAETQLRASAGRDGHELRRPAQAAQPEPATAKRPGAARRVRSKRPDTVGM